jgi:hypothetical protein
LLDTPRIKSYEDYKTQLDEYALSYTPNEMLTITQVQLVRIFSQTIATVDGRKAREGVVFGSTVAILVLQGRILRASL